MTHELRLTHFLLCHTQNLTHLKLKSRFQVKLNYTTRLTDIRLKMFILHVKCNLMKSSRIYCPTATSYSNIFDELFFFDTLTAGHFSTKTVHSRVLALSILRETGCFIIVFIWLFVKGKDFSTCWFFSCEN